MRLEENIHGFKKAEKLAKKNGWKIVKTIPKDTGAINESRKFKESSSKYGLNDVKTDGDVFRAIEGICSSEGMDSESIFTNCARHQVVWGLEEKLLNGEDLTTIDRLNMACLLASNLDHDGSYEPMDGYNESTRKFGKKFTKESIGADPALVCPYCGGNNCEVSIGTDDLNFTGLDRL